MKKTLLPLLVFLLICAPLLFTIVKPERNAENSPLIGKELPDINVDSQALRSLTAGKITVINIFASWCLPCAVEHGEFMKLKALGLANIIGIAWKNKPEDARQWLAARGNPYHNLLFDEKGNITVALALTGVPETFIVDSSGLVVYHSRKPVTADILNEEIIPLLERLRQ